MVTWAPRIAAASVVISSAMLLALHVLPPSRDKDPMSRTVSEYALMGNAWLFAGGVLVLAAGSAVLVVEVVRTSRVRLASPAGIAWCGWCLGLVGLVVFPKTEMGPDTSLLGRTHWSFTLLAFLSLPIAVAFSRRRLPAGRATAVAGVLTWMSAGWFVVLAGQTVLSGVGVPAWQWVGAVERGLAATEAALVLCVAVALRPGRGSPLGSGLGSWSHPRPAAGVDDAEALGRPGESYVDVAQPAG